MKDGYKNSDHISKTNAPTTTLKKFLLIPFPAFFLQFMSLMSLEDGLVGDVLRVPGGVAGVDRVGTFDSPGAAGLKKKIYFFKTET